jgi:hypothetical protein
MRLRPPRASALLLLCAMPLVPAAACSFSAPNGGGGGGGDDDGSGGGGIDAPPPCADDDGDTVCNAADKCPGKDDRPDADGDGVPDDCDDWPCGAKPADPGDPMGDSSSDGRGWSAAGINIGMSRRVVVPAGQQYSAQFGWGMIISCFQQSFCRAQIELGYGATRAGCIYDNFVEAGRLITGGYNGQLTAPAVPGVYELRLNVGRSSSCGSGTSWYGGDPGGDSTIAVLCVRP